MTRHMTSGKKYLKSRPHFPDSFFDRIFSYHAQHGGSFETAHDAGAGADIHSARLVKRFEHVFVTDAAKDNIDTAREQLQGPDHERYEFEVSKLEDTISLPGASIDMVFAGVMIHFTNLDQAMAAVAHQLKPRDTFVAVGFGYAVLEDEAAQDVWLRLWQKGGEQYLNGQGTSTDERLKRALMIGASAYDPVPVPQEYFQSGTLRIRLNWPGDECWYRYCVPDALEDQFPTKWSHVGPADVVSTESEGGGDLNMNTTELRGILETFPNINLNSNEMIKLWTDFESLVGNLKMKGYWPAFMILATRK